MHGTSGQNAAAAAAAARPAPSAAGPARVAWALALTLGVAACWYIAIRRMSGMDMGTSTSLGSFWSFRDSWPGTSDVNDAEDVNVMTNHPTGTRAEWLAAPVWWRRHDEYSA
jgi:hypothetical protein